MHQNSMSCFAGDERNAANTQWEVALASLTQAQTARQIAKASQQAAQASAKSAVQERNTAVQLRNAAVAAQQAALSSQHHAETASVIRSQSRNWLASRAACPQISAGLNVI